MVLHTWQKSNARQRPLGTCSTQLCNGRTLQVRMKRAFQSDQSDECVHELQLRHGDLMTMEGLHQLWYLHSARPTPPP